MSIPRVARYTWSRQWYALGLIGMSVGVFQIAPFLIRRDLGGSRWDTGLLIMIWQAPWILAPAVEPLMARVNPQHAWRWMALIAHAPLLLIAFLPAALPLMLVLGCYYLNSIAYIPHRGALIRTNYAPAVRGRMYGLIQVVTLLGVMFASKGAGKMMDGDPRWVRALFPVGAVLGFLGFWLHGRIRWRGQRRPRVPRVPGLLATWREVGLVLKTDRQFRVYEIGFMIYGFAFLAGWPLLFNYAEGPLGLSYDEFTDAIGYGFPVALIAGAWVWGRVSDRVGVVRLTALAFLSLAAFYVFMQLVRGHGTFVGGYLLFGFAMAAVDVGWSLGPLHFAPDGKAHMYAAVHFSLVGVRSLAAPFLGLLIADAFGYRVAFACCSTLLVVAALIVWRLSRRTP